MQRLAKAIYRHTAEGPDELSFEQGEVLTIVGESVEKGEFSKQSRNEIFSLWRAL